MVTIHARKQDFPAGWQGFGNLQSRVKELRKPSLFCSQIGQNCQNRPKNPLHFGLKFVKITKNWAISSSVPFGLKYVKIAKNREMGLLLLCCQIRKNSQKSRKKFTPQFNFWSQIGQKAKFMKKNVFDEQTVTTRKSRKEVNNSLLFTSDRRIYDGITPLPPGQ